MSGVDASDQGRFDASDSEDPELTAEDFARARPFSEVFPDLHKRIVSQGLKVDRRARKAS